MKDSEFVIARLADIKNHLKREVVNKPDSGMNKVFERYMETITLAAGLIAMDRD